MTSILKELEIELDTREGNNENVSKLPKIIKHITDLEKQVGMLTGVLGDHYDRDYIEKLKKDVLKEK